MAYGQNMNAPMSGLMSLAAMKGRMGDNTLVHVNPMELKALDAMAPGGLTKNPSTGLPEAFKLKDALPILLGIAAPFAPILMGGSALTGLAGAAAAGAGSAAGTALAGGNREEILTSGLISGVTAGMLGGTGDAAGKAVTEAGKGAGLQTAAEASKGTIASQIGSKFADPALIAQKAVVDGAFSVPAGLVAQQAVGQQLLGQAAGAGIGGLAASQLTQDVPQVPGYERPEQVTISKATPTGTPEQQQADIDRYIRQGGATPTFFNYSPAQVSVPYTYAEEGGSLSETPVAQGEMFSGMVEDNGTGDGMSDNVEFEVVGDPEIGRAMLSPDEYVMDAYTVAALGNGSADAGADKLDKFREALRKKVYGSEKQPNEIDGAKELSRLA